MVISCVIVVSLSVRYEINLTLEFELLVRKSSSCMRPFNVEEVAFLDTPPPDATTLNGASRHERGRQVNFVPGGSRSHAGFASIPCGLG